MLRIFLILSVRMVSLLKKVLNWCILLVHDAPKIPRNGLADAL